MALAEGADQLAEMVDEDKVEEAHERRFRTQMGLLVAILAVLLAIASLGGSNAAEDALNSNILARDSWAFYQAKNIRQTSLALARDELELRLAGDSFTPAQREKALELIESYQATIARYDSEPDPEDPEDFLKGEGKRELAQRAQYYEAAREEATAQDGNFDMAEASFQIAIVLASVAILSLSTLARAAAIGFGVLGLALMLNGFFMVVPLP